MLIHSDLGPAKKNKFATALAQGSFVLAQLTSFAKARTGLILLLLLGVVYVSANLTPSSYSLSRDLVEAPREGLLLGTPRPVRADEYLILTPYFQIAVRNQFKTSNAFSAYGEHLKSFYALPLADWSIAFKPQLWGFFVLSPARAYSLYHFILIASFLTGYTLLLRQLGADRSTSILVCVIFFFCHFVQVWWTNNGPTFAFAPWPIIAHLSGWRMWARAPAVFFTSCVWLFSLLYPPFIIGAAFAFFILLLAFRPESLRIRVALPSAIAISAALAVAWIYFNELIDVMRSTYYPGQREYGGGSVPWRMVAASVFPYMAIVQYEPLYSGSGVNASEIGSMGTFLPLALLAFADHRRMLLAAKQNLWTPAICLIGLGLIVAWFVLPLPSGVGRPLLWHIVAPSRLQWAGGLILILSLGVLASKIPWRFTIARTAIASLIVIAAWVFSKYIMVRIWPPPQGLGSTLLLPISTWFDWIFIVPLWMAFFLHRASWPGVARWRLQSREAILAVCAITGATTFGMFNPLQSARPIFDVPETALTQSLRSMAAAHPENRVAIEGAYGAVLNGLGIPALNHVLLAPQLDFFRRSFPELSDKQISAAFNRYGQILPSADSEIKVPYPDTINVPIHRFGLNLPVSVEGGDTVDALFANSPIGGSADTVTPTRLGPDHWRVHIRGWCVCENWSADQILSVRIASDFSASMAITAATAVRLPRTDVVRAFKNERLGSSGYLLTIELRTSDSNLPVSGPTFEIVSSDPAVGHYRVSFSKQ